MKIETDNPEIINLYKEYQFVKQFIKTMKDLYTYLKENHIMKVTPSYFLFYGDKSRKHLSNKFRKYLMRNYINQNDVNTLCEMDDKYDNYNLIHKRHNDCLGDLQFYTHNDYKLTITYYPGNNVINHDYMRTCISKFNLYGVFRIKNKLKILILAKHENAEFGK